MDAIEIIPSDDCVLVSVKSGVLSAVFALVPTEAFGLIEALQRATAKFVPSYQEMRGILKRPAESDEADDGETHAVTMPIPPNTAKPETFRETGIADKDKE